MSVVCKQISLWLLALKILQALILAMLLTFKTILAGYQIQRILVIMFVMKTSWSGSYYSLLNSGESGPAVCQFTVSLTIRLLFLPLPPSSLSLPQLSATLMTLPFPTGLGYLLLAYSNGTFSELPCRVGTVVIFSHWFASFLKGPLLHTHHTPPCPIYNWHLINVSQMKFEFKRRIWNLTVMDYRIMTF